MRINIPVEMIEVDDNGNTIWIHNKDGVTVMRIKTMGKILFNENKNGNNSCDIITNQNILLNFESDVFEGEKSGNDL